MDHINRDIKSLMRNMKIVLVNWLLYIVSAFLLAIFSHNLSNDLSGCQSRIGSICFAILTLSITSVGSVWLVLSEFTVIKKEISSGLYRAWIYIVSKFIVHLTVLRILPTIVFSLAIYIPMGVFADHWWDYTYKCIIFTSVLLLVSSISTCIAMIIGFIIPRVDIFTPVFCVFVIVMNLFNGVSISMNSIPSYMKWVYYTSYVRYAAESLFINEFLHKNVIINVEGFKGLNITMPVDGSFYLDKLGTRHWAMESDIFLLSTILIILIFVVILCFYLMLCCRKREQLKK